MPKSILLIDDDVRVTDLLARWLSPEFEVLTASTGAQGLARFRERKPEIVVLDIMLPDISGTEVLKTLRADDSKAFVVMLSGNPDLSLAKESIRLGADDYIVKPFHPGHVRDVLRAGRPARD